MSGLTVRSYVKMMFDEGSYQKTQQQYNAALARLQNEGLSTVNKANSSLKQEHADFVADMLKQQKAADKALETNNKQVTDKIASQSRKAAMARTPGMDKVKLNKDGAVAQYKWNVKRYEESLKKMQAANAKYVAHAKSVGASARLTKSGMLDTAAFGANDATMRRRLINDQEHLVTIQKTSAERTRQLVILQDMRAVDKGILANEYQRNAVISDTNRKMSMSLSNLRRQLAQNNTFYREQLQLQMQINMSLQRMKTNLQQGLVGALMVSAIALMSFGFKLQGVVETFKEFEKELINAQSIFQTTDEVLYGLSDQIVMFGTKYGVSLGQASEGLYTLASAGLSAADAQEVLSNTLKLSMAVQGDHETIAKLTTQTIFGFGMEMSESAMLTDKFAHSINKSLIEYQDLASAVKFAMPFFVATGQSIDQLLGGIEVLTNRALEAGIAGRGLRQALAQIAKHANDNEDALKRLGIETMNTDGTMKDLTDIANQAADAFAGQYTEVEALVAMLESMNVRGATAFALLAQNADEFTAAVDNLENAAGSATEMAEIQQQSLANQIQVVKNALMAPFLLSDKVAMANGDMNTFSKVLHDMVADFEAFFIVTMSDGTRILSENGAVLRDLVIASLRELSGMMLNLLKSFENMNASGKNFGNILHAILLPITSLLRIFSKLPSGMLEAVMMFKVMNMILPVASLRTTALTMAIEGNTLSQLSSTMAQENAAMASGRLSVAQHNQIMVSRAVQASNASLTMSYTAVSMSMMGANALLMVGFVLMQRGEPVIRAFAAAMVVLAGAMMGYALAQSLMQNSVDATAIARFSAGMAVGGAALVGGLALLMQTQMTPETYDMGGRIYDSGGSLGGRHFPVMVEPGESIIPKTQNMLGGGAGGGITLNIGGDIVTNDAEDFAQRIAEVLPSALRHQSDIGGI